MQFLIFFLFFISCSGDVSVLDRSANCFLLSQLEKYQCLERLIEETPQDHSLWQLYSVILRSDGKKEESLSILEERADATLQTSPEPLFQAGIACINLNLFDRARKKPVEKL